MSAGLVAQLTTQLIDDAAVFPPGAAPMPQAIADHRGHRRAWYADLVGPLLIPAARVTEFAAHLDDGALGPPSTDPVQVVLIAGRDTHSPDDGIGLVALSRARNALLDDDRVELVGIELALPEFDDLGALTQGLLSQLGFGVPAAIEVPRTDGWQRALDVLADDGAERAKLRTGGPGPSDVPTDAELTSFLAACVERRLPFKLTAGLHHAIRRTGDDAPEHGFLNVLAAVISLLGGASASEAQALVAERDPARLLEVFDSGSAPAARALFTSYGSCSISDPLDDLVALGILHRPLEEA